MAAVRANARLHLAEDRILGRLACAGHAGTGAACVSHVVNAALLQASQGGVFDQLYRRRLLPLRHQRRLDWHRVRAIGKVEPVAVGPVLVHAFQGIGAVVLDLAAEHVAA
jgi:hypothetical protein